MTALKEHARSEVRSATMGYPRRRALNSTVKQVLAENPQYVPRFWHIDCAPLNWRRVLTDLGFS